MVYRHMIITFCENGDVKYSFFRHHSRYMLTKYTILFLVAVWLVMGTGGLGPSSDDAERTLPVRVGQVRGRVELIRTDDRTPTVRLIMPGGGDPAVMDLVEAEHYLGREVVDVLTAEHSNWLFQLFNITSWTSLLWIGVGLLGQTAFLLRMLVQWLVSEKRGQSIVPEVFWWLSLGGAVALFSYFIWRRDIVGVLGQSTGVVIYARNLRLIHKRASEAAAPV